MERMPGERPQSAPDGDDQNGQEESWSRREELLNSHERGAGFSLDLDGNLDYLLNDLMRYAWRSRSLLDQVDARLSDPLDKLNLLRGTMSEVNKTVREIRSLIQVKQQLKTKRDDADAA